MGFMKKLLGLSDLPPPNVVHVTDANFKTEVLKSKLPVLLDVWGPNCMPCKHLEPVISRLSQEYDGRVKVAELNAATAAKTAKKLRVRGTPTVIYFYKGQVRERVVGFRAGHYHKDYLDNELLPLIEPKTPSSSEADAPAA
ncbi:MAG: thioredoxin domain-containing protein [Deltaproteobacteria bacterium]|nr:thioredoxin domain-containing protein [Deltaproteobacteria bacterium]